MVKHPSPIELLELDIDLRIAGLWVETIDVDQWSTDVVLALMRVAYGKGYCDALTEEEPGALCRDHGSVVSPPARDARSSSSVRLPTDHQPMAKHPSPIELLELDIDLRIAHLWAEMVEVDEWSLDVVVALMRVAYGKGYCDALTEEEPGVLCRDHSDVVLGRERALSAYL